MSSRKSKKNRDKKKNREDKEDKRNGEKYTRQGNGTNNGNEELSAVTFKYPGRYFIQFSSFAFQHILHCKSSQIWPIDLRHWLGQSY